MLTGEGAHIVPRSGKCPCEKPKSEVVCAAVNRLMDAEMHRGQVVRTLGTVPVR